MKIGIVIKQVPDTETQIVLKPNKNGVEQLKFKYVLNPYDEFAVGKALGVRESFPESEVVVFSIGPRRVSNTILDVLAIGADRGIHVVDEENRAFGPRIISKILARLLQEEAIELIFTGSRTVDDDIIAIPQMIAEYLKIPQASFVSKLDFIDGHTIRVERNVDGGAKEIYEMELPCLVAATRGLGKMRYATIPGIRAASKKEIREISLEACDFTADQSEIRYTNWELPPKRTGCKMIEGDPELQAAELVRLLREEVSLI